MNLIRCAKGAVTASAATAACYTLMYRGYAWAREAADTRTARGGTFGGAIEHLLTTAGSWTLMPLLLWAGMRLLREGGNTVFVLAGGAAWVLVSGILIDDIDFPGSRTPYVALAAYVLFCTMLSGKDQPTKP
ncbi:hypothetical protein [Streptomyces tsukubensis]|uniref:hypothetical protein n=1 Tax=Streptomyces tsukubensis TaxID=83656 RepID=UPI00344F2FB3